MTNKKQEADKEMWFKKILQDAADIAQRAECLSYNTYHLLLAIMRKDYFLRNFLKEKNVSFNKLLEDSPEAGREELFIGSLLGRVGQIAKTANQPRLPIHLLYGILSYGDDCLARQALRLYCNPDQIQLEIIHNNWLRNPPNQNVEVNDKKTILQIVGKDFTQMAREGKFKSLVGRNSEVEKIVKALARKDTSEDCCDEAINNPLLLGEAGVGKTANAKYFALLISQKDERVQLFWNHRVVYVNLGNLQAGTGVRGTLESKLEAILSECSEGGQTILFLDELHTIMGLGKSEGSSGLEETLKPVLAEGLSCIGATTIAEFRKHIEPNTAFARRWIPIIIDEPGEDETLEIVKQDVDNLARRHMVHFSEEVLKSAVQLGRKFISTEYSPGREIETILNGVGSHVKISGRTKAMVSDVETVISDITGIPIEVDEVVKNKVLRAYEILSEKIVGQDEANKAFADAIIRQRSGLADTEKPLVILALGPTGSGKTHSANVITKEFMYGRKFMINMAEYRERHTVSKLIGAPPGYIGYGTPGILTDAIRRLGMGVGLLDEIEKAHSDVHQLFLQLFDEGRITDSQGKTVNGKNCIFIMTSNIGAQYFNQDTVSAGIGFTPNKNQEMSYDQICVKVIAEAKRHFSPEFFNRIDKVLVYRPLTRDAIHNIVKILLNNEQNKCSKKGFSLEWSEEVIIFLAQKGYCKTNGARPLKRFIVENVVNLLSKPVLRGEIDKDDSVYLYVDNGKINWRK